MASLQTIVASLGNAGAIHNAQVGIEQRQREDWLVACLEAKLTPPPATVGPTGTGTRADVAA